MASVMPMPPELCQQPVKDLENSPDDIQCPVDPEELHKAVCRAGSALVAVLGSANITSGCRTALGRMADSGKALELVFVDEIRSTGVLAHCSKMDSGLLQNFAIQQLVELREAVAACATVTMNWIPAVELMALWSVVHESVSDVLTEEAVALAGKLTQDAPQILEAAEDIGADAIAIGKILATALASSTILVSSVSDELREAIQHLTDAGTPVTVHLAAELRNHLPAIRDALSELEWTKLHSYCSQSIATEWRALGEAADKVAKRTTDAVEMVKRASSDVFDSPFAKAIAAQGLAGMDGILGQTRDVIDTTLDALRDGGVGAVGAVAACLTRFGLPPLLRVEIARDFFQTAGLFFSGLYGSVVEFVERQSIAKDVTRLLNGLRSAYDVMAVNVLALVKAGSQDRALLIDIALGMLLTAIGVIYASFLWFAFFGRHLHRRADEVRQGHEATTWAALATKQKMRVKLFTYVITACLTIYLPLTRLCLDVLVADTRTSDTEDNTRAISASDLVVSRFRDDKAWPAIVVAAGILLVTFTIPLPWLLINVISENRPTGSLENPLVTHDLDGEEVPFDDKVYARLVARDPSQLRCPYRSLYAGFEQRWRYYKIFQLLVKLALVLVVVVAASADARIRGVLSCVIYASVVALSSYGTPFSDPLNNVMEISGKMTALATCVGGALAAFVDVQHTRSRMLETVVAVISVLHIVNLFVMVAALLLGMRGTRLFLKNMLGWITFSDTSRGLMDAPARNVLLCWDIDKEVKHRVWQAFWRSIMLDLSQNTQGNADELTVAHRLEALEQAIVASGVRRVRSHWRGEDNAYTAKLRQATCATLEGVDVFWDDTSGARDGHLDSSSYFGKMYVKPYPFHCIVVYDDSKDEAIVRDDDEDSSRQSKLTKLLFLNFTPRIVAKRELRQNLRVLSASGTSVHFPFSREEKAKVEDGTITRTDSNGNTRTEKRYSTVSFTCYYTRGVLHVATKGDATGRIMAEGFVVSMTYRDGYGDAVAPHTGKVHHLENRVAEMGPEHVGLTPAMEESEQLRTIFEQTRQVWESGVQELRTQYQGYRQALAHKHSAANATLSDAFWYFVYNNPSLSREDLENHLRCREENKRLHSLAETHRDALDSLYLRMKFVQSHPVVMFWFVFWDDIYARNGEMKRLRKFKQDLDPREPTAICYHVMQRPDLENWLRERRLLGTRCLFHPHLLALLYKEMDKRLEVAVKK